MRVKNIYLFFFLSIWPCTGISDTIYFYEGYNKLQELNCKVYSIDSTYVSATYYSKDVPSDVKIHISRVFYIKFNDEYISPRKIVIQQEWQELYNIQADNRKKRLYLKDVTDSLTKEYSDIRFSGKDANIITGDILAYSVMDSIITFSAVLKTHADTIVTDWDFVPYLSTWYRY